MDDEDFLDAIEADNKAQTVEEPEVLELTEEAPAEPVAPIVAEPVIAPQIEAKPEPVMVPLAALHETRDEVKALKAQLQALQPAAQPQQVPDRWEDPDGFDAYRDQKAEAALYAANLRWSERIATIQHGEDTVKQARDWAFARCDSDPFFNAQVASSPDPLGFAVAEWKRDQIASQVNPDDFAQFQAWKTAQATINAPTPGQPANPNQPRIAPPRSLASAPSAGSVMTEVEPDEDEIFEGAFKR